MTPEGRLVLEYPVGPMTPELVTYTYMVRRRSGGLVGAVRKYLRALRS